MSLINGQKYSISSYKNYYLNLNGNNTVVKCISTENSGNQTWTLNTVSNVTNGFTLSITRSDGTTYYLSNGGKFVSTTAYTWIIEASDNSTYTIANNSGSDAKYLTQVDEDKQKPTLKEKDNSDDQKWVFVFIRGTLPL
jgi:hypothetical protein